MNHLFFSIICMPKLITPILSRSWDDYYPDTPYNQSIESKDPVTYQTKYYYYVNNVIFDNLISQAIYASSYIIHMVIEDTTFTNISSTSNHGGAIFLTNSIYLIQNKVCSSKCISSNNGHHMYINAGNTKLKTTLSSFAKCGNYSHRNSIISVTSANNYLANSNISKCQCSGYSAFNFHYCLSPSNVTFCNFESCVGSYNTVLGKGMNSNSHFLQVTNCTIYNCSCQNYLIDFAGYSSVSDVNFIDNVIKTSSSPILINADKGLTLTNCYFENTPQTFAAVVQTNDIMDSKLEIVNENYPITRCPDLDEEVTKSKTQSDANVKLF